MARARAVAVDGERGGLALVEAPEAADCVVVGVVVKVDILGRRGRQDASEARRESRERGFVLLHKCNVLE